MIDMVETLDRISGKGEVTRKDMKDLFAWRDKFHEDLRTVLGGAQDGNREKNVQQATRD